MTSKDVAQAVEALIAAIKTVRRGLPRGPGGDDAARALLLQCQEAKKLIHDQCKRIERRGYRPARFVTPAQIDAPLAQQVIDAGYKALAAKLHPDKGGSNDGMARLNLVREKLRRA